MSLPIVSLDPVPEPSDRGAGSAPAAPTVRRHVESFLLDLSVRGVRQGVTLPPGTQAAYVAATPACGAWAVNTLYVRVGAAGGSVPFVVAKAVAAGGGLAVVTVDDAPGLAEIVVGVDPASAPEAAGAAAVVVVSADVKY